MLTAGVATVPPYGAVTVSLTAFLYAVLFICPTDFFFFFYWHSVSLVELVLFNHPYHTDKKAQMTLGEMIFPEFRGRKW